MIQYGYIALRQFPKAERFALVAEIKITMWRLLRYIVICNKRYYKKNTMQDLDAELDLLRAQVRAAKDLEFLPFKKYEVWGRFLDEIGKMIGGWLKSVKNGSGA